jgi:capsular polysaccharide biosynthesis protein
MQPSPLKHYWLAILLTTVTTFVASVVFTVSQPMEYRAQFTVLVLEKNPNLDGYAAAKAAERLSQSLAKAITTAAFSDSVYNQIKSNPNLEGNPIISEDPQTRQDAWRKEITTVAQPEVGQVKVSIFQKERSQATILANAISIATVGLGNDYLSSGNTVSLKVVDYPLTSKVPVRPNIFVNLAAGVFVGLAGSMIFIALFAAKPLPTTALQPLVTPITPTLLAKPELHIPTPKPVTPYTPPVTPPTSSPFTPTAPTEKPELPIVSTDVPMNLPVDDEWVMP